MNTRIVHIGKYYPPHLGGTEAYTWQLASHQAEWARVTVLAASDGRRTQREVMDGVEVIRMGTFGVISSMPITPLLPLHVTRLSADIIHLHLPNPSAAASALLSRSQVPFVITHHADTLTHHAETRGRPFYKMVSDPFRRWAMRRADAVIVTSDAYLTSSTELLEFRDKCRIIPLGIDPAPFLGDHGREAAEIRRKYGSRIITCIGRLVRIKGFSFAIEAMKTTSGVLLIIGTGVLENELRALAHTVGVADRVVFLGAAPNDQIPGILAATDVFAFPTTNRNESFGIAQLEAMASGVPVVNTWVKSGVPEVSVDGVTGLTVPPMDAAALAKAFELLLESEITRRKLGQQGRERVLREYTLQLMLRRTDALYEEVFGGRCSLPAKGKAKNSARACY